MTSILKSLPAAAILALSACTPAAAEPASLPAPNDVRELFSEVREHFAAVQDQFQDLRALLDRMDARDRAVMAEHCRKNPGSVLPPCAAPDGA